jgi:replicative DNA helicase
VLATAAGGRAVVEIKPGWREPLNLYTAVAMPPGARKTPVFLRVITPIAEHERAATEAARADVNDAVARKAVAAAEAKRALQEAEHASGDAQEEAIHFASAKAQMAEAVTVPALPRLLADDATPEALTSLLAEQGGRLGLFSDEGEVFNMMAGRYSTAGPNLAVYLKGHVGSPIRVDRKGRDAEYIESPALTLGLTVQPEVLESVMAIQGARGRGLLGRFLWSVPLSNMGTRDADPPAMLADIEARYVEETKVLVGSLAEWTDPVPLVFTEDARTALIGYQRALEPRLGPRGDLDHISDWASKLVGHVARIAGLLHLATNVRTGWSAPVERDTVDDAIHIGNHLIDHALIAFDAMVAGEARLNARALLSWIEDREIDRFSRRDAQRAHQHRFADVEELKDALALLEGNGFIRRLPEPERTTKGGRPPGPNFSVNPLFGREHA